MRKYQITMMNNIMLQEIFLIYLLKSIMYLLSIKGCINHMNNSFKKKVSSQFNLLRKSLSL